MRTKGIEVHHGYLVHHGTNDIPDALWARLKHEASKRQLLDDLKADWKAEVEPEHGPGRIYAEHHLFRDWVTTLFGTPAKAPPFDAPLWPWTCGWTEERLDSYLTRSVVEVV